MSPEPPPLPGTWTAWALSSTWQTANRNRPELANLLDGEFDRHQRARDGTFRDRLVASRAFAKWFAFRVLGHPVRLVKDARGKPGLADQDGQPVPGVDFSLAHTGDVLAVAVSRAGRVGVDVEVRDRPVDSPAFRARACHPAEPTDDPVRLWTVKEAIAKARGEGLLLDFRTVRADRPPPGWRVHTEVVADRYRLTTALGPWEKETA
ncbi:4'-phosphopantetheinyl transferase family protein [Actinokineospora spheciospongiae]|uniref:4'-phosphopantetheinyl transferase family protein n=1 Tax=Actinokineospora spheciospongiae TaxID=909613 RepID=UPI00068C42BF|nr:4'-phosphopantetheinyl transferase superfamily protein [Actinokineospora spheciospongiae]